MFIITIKTKIVDINEIYNLGYIVNQCF